VTPEVQAILQSFEALPETDKRDLASEIVRRTLKSGQPAVSDEDLVSIAEETFLELDREESPVELPRRRTDDGQTM